MGQTPVVYRDPRDQVEWPANLLIVFAGLSVLGHVGRLLMNLVGFGLGTRFGSAPEAVTHLVAGSMGLIFSLVGLVVAGFIIYAALEMKQLRSYPVCIAAAALAILPGCSPCCCLGIPLGVWTLVVITSPEVRAAFR
jgi:hypothetical protein